MPFGLTETFDSKGKIATQPVRYRTEISMGFPQAGAKFLAGLQRDSILQGGSVA
jgi:hypothetical protein